MRVYIVCQNPYVLTAVVVYYGFSTSISDEVPGKLLHLQITWPPIYHILSK